MINIYKRFSTDFVLTPAFERHFTYGGGKNGILTDWVSLLLAFDLGSCLPRSPRLYAPPSALFFSNGEWDDSDRSLDDTRTRWPAVTRKRFWNVLLVWRGRDNKLHINAVTSKETWCRCCAHTRNATLISKGKFRSWKLEPLVSACYKVAKTMASV